jgi:hypothetical protein
MATVQITRCAPANAAGSEEECQFADKHRQAISATFAGGSDWESTGIAFEDYTRCTTRTHVKDRVSTPAWAQSPEKVSRVLAMRLRQQAGGSQNVNPWTLPTDREALLALESDAWNCLRGYIDSGAHNATAFITSLECYAKNGGILKFLSKLIYYRLQQGWTSTATAQHLGIRPEAVRHHCHNLNRVAKRLWPAQPELHLPQHWSQKYAVKPFLSPDMEPQQVVDKRSRPPVTRRYGRWKNNLVDTVVLLKQAGMARAVIEEHLTTRWQLKYGEMQSILTRAGVATA